MLGGKRSSRRTSSSKPSSSTQSQSESTWPPVSFLFVVNKLPINDDPDDGGVPPLTNDDGRWVPPVYSAGFSPQIPGTVHRWSNGVITAATGYQWYGGTGYAPNSGVLNFYRAATVFFCNPFTQFACADGDASTFDIARADFPNNRWYPLTFRHDETLSRIDVVGENQVLAGPGAPCVNQFGLTSYDCQDRSASNSTGFAGNLAILIALIAFTCRTRDLDTVLQTDRAWHNYRWRGHNKHHARVNGRGMVVTIYLDPENQPGSTARTLWELEWTRGAILQ